MAIKSDKKKLLPQPWYVLPAGEASEKPCEGAIRAWFLPDQFNFCPNCLVLHTGRSSEFTKLDSLGTEGRSTSTTILSMSTVAHLAKEPGLPPKAGKFLCFTDNRQDASLQSGHFNDFLETGLVRSALCHALEIAHPAGIPDNELGEKIMASLGTPYPDGIFPRHLYAQKPEAVSANAFEADRAFKNILLYRLYSDLKRGWRIVAPNLEQCGLLEIEYRGLDSLCSDNQRWAANPLLQAASPEERMEICMVLLDHMRSRLALAAEPLQKNFHESMAKASRAHLADPWLIENEKILDYASYAFLGSKAAKDQKFAIALTPRSRYGRWLKREFFPGASTDDIEHVLSSLLAILDTAGIATSTPDNGRTLWQIAPDVMIWKLGDGRKVKVDPFRVRLKKGDFGKPNPFFQNFYRTYVKNAVRLHSREHTAQISDQERRERENAFRDATLPVLYCSPTMELGVDIEELNAVGMRNVPPTPANYAQRSGRAGRAGQPALVLTWCARGNSHDQHFFRFPAEMVAGAVSPPRLDLLNEDLLKSHIHSIWLAATGMSLYNSMRHIVNVDAPDYPLLDEVENSLAREDAKRIARTQAERILESLGEDLERCAWYYPRWLDDLFANLRKDFDAACDHWRSLYRIALAQGGEAHRMASSSGLDRRTRNQWLEIHREAVKQQVHLLNDDKQQRSDFYPYRYFASEGFLPGYNFPRLPLSVWLPAGARGIPENISRSRFLALREFGPSSIIYHNGSKYRINGVQISGREDGAPVFESIKICEKCGHLEKVTIRDLCEMCGAELPPVRNNLFKMPDVRAVKIARITSDEEERLRHGYKIVSAWQFAVTNGRSVHTAATCLTPGGEPLARLKYGPATTLWRVNEGWRKSPPHTPPGFFLDTLKGTWQRNDLGKRNIRTDLPDADLEAPGFEARRVLPYVEDRKNCLFFEPAVPLLPAGIVTLAAALKRAIQDIYQLEDSELESEILPSSGEPKEILLVEAAEGGAGILRHLVEMPDAVANLAKKALEICHFDPDGNDLFANCKDENACVNACYNCLMNYGNQLFHNELNRHDIRLHLLSLATSRTELATAKDHLATLLKACDSNLEKKWLKFIVKYQLNLPDRAQAHIPQCNTKPDFWYEKRHTAIYIDGPDHDSRRRQNIDAEQEECLEDLGISVIHFAYNEDWLSKIRRHPAIFGNPPEEPV